MSKGWKNGRIGDLISSFESGVSVNGEDREPSDNEYAVLKVSSVTYGHFNPKASKPISGKELDRAKCTPRAGQIIISRASGTSAHVGASTYVYENYPMRFLSDKLWQTVPNPNVETNMKWLSYCLASPKIRSQILGFATGTNIKNITKKEFLWIPIQIPPIQEQNKIAEMLDLWENAIEKTKALIAAKEKQFEWLISELISKPNEEKKDNWKQVKLGDIGEISSAGVDKKIIKGEIPVRLINYLDVYRSDFIDSKNITHQVTAPAAKASKCATQKGDIFFTPSSELRGDIGHSSVATEDMLDAVYSYHVVRLRLHENWDLKYRAYAFKARNFFKQAYKYADGSGQRYVISQNNFRKMEILVPPLETQQKISNILSEAQKEIHLLKKTLEKYRTQKRGLMQKLLTGEWQVGSTQSVSEGTLQELSKENVA